MSTHILRGIALTEEAEVGYARPTGGPVGETIETESTEEQPKERDVSPVIHVGKKTPDSTAPAYFKSKLSNVQLSEYPNTGIFPCFSHGILPLSEQRKFRQLPKRIPSFRSLVLTYYR